MASIARQLSALADHLQARRPAILDHWQTAVRDDTEIPSSDALPLGQLFDHIPAMLLGLEQELRTATADATPSKQEQALASAHGQQRWQQGFELREVVRELGTLNECVVTEIDGYGGAGHATSYKAMCDARRIWSKIYKLAIQESLERYFALQRREAACHVEDLERALQSVCQLEKQRLDLWRQAAHDLRGNLSVVANVTVGLTRRELVEPAREEFVRILMRNVTFLHHLLDDVASLTRLEAGQESAHLETVDISALMYQLCEGVRSIAQQRRLFIRCDGPPDFAAQGDPVKIRRIAQNLILNAVKYTQQGGITVSWRAIEASQPPRWRLSISDTGPGFSRGPESLLTDMLEVREMPEGANTLRLAAQNALGDHQDAAPSSHDTKGEGIGLSIVKRLCDLLNATIEVETGQLAGTTFRITFPRGESPLAKC